MLIAPNRRARSGFSSTLTRMTFTPPAWSRAIASSTGAIIRQGAHHGAQKSTTTGTEARTSASKDASSASTSQGSRFLQFAQRGTPSTAGPTRFVVPQFGQRMNARRSVWFVPMTLSVGRTAGAARHLRAAGDGLPHVAVRRDDRCRESPDPHGAHPRLTDEQVGTLVHLGERRPIARGDVLYRAGEHPATFFVVLDGIVEVVDRLGEAEERVLFVHGRHRFLGELGVLTGEPAYLTAVACADGEVLAVPADRVRELVGEDVALGDLLLRALLRRRSLLLGIGTGVKLVGSRFSPDTRRLRDFLARNRIPSRWIDVEEDASAEALLRMAGVSARETPVVVCGDRVLRNPTNAELAAALGLRSPRGPDGAVDLVIVGAGPAGLAAAVYGASEGIETLVVEAAAVGGQAGTSPRIENYLGFPSGISGDDLVERAFIQAEKFGAQLVVPAAATGLESDEGVHRVHLADGGELAARSVLVASGVRYRRLDIPGVSEFEGVAVFYAATQVEAAICVAEPVAVVGGGNSGAQAALFLAQRATRVWLVIREAGLEANMSRYLADRIRRTSGIEVLLHTEVRELRGESGMESMAVEDTRSGERRVLPARRLFVFIGAEPHTDWLREAVVLDERGFVLTGPRLEADGRRRPPLALETSRPGVLAAGDVRAGSVRRMAAAVGEGAMAIRLLHGLLATADDETTRDRARRRSSITG